MHKSSLFLDEIKRITKHFLEIEPLVGTSTGLDLNMKISIEIFLLKSISNVKHPHL